MHIHNYNECIIITDIRNFMHSYHGLKQVLKLITSLCLFRTLIGVTELILILRSLHLFGGTRRVSQRLRNVYWYCGTYSYTEVLVSTTKLILVLHILLVLRSISWSYGTYTGLTEHILILRMLCLCEGTRRYNKSELIIIVSHRGSNQTYADTYQVWTLVHSRYRS